MSNIISSKGWLNPIRIIIIVLGVSLAGAAAFYFWPRATASVALPQANVPAADYWPTEGWQFASPESLGLDSAKLATVLDTVKRNETPMHSWLVMRNGQIVLDAYFYPYDGTTLHDMASATKSVTTTLIGIAIDKGYLNLDDSMVSFFPERTIANRNEWKEQITVRDLMTMSSGLHCDDKGGEERTQAEMRASDDWIQFVLDLEAIHEPGTVFAYCSPGSYMLSAILTQATGMSELAFAQKHLFGPLGIEEVFWPADSNGINYGWGDLAMYPQDAAKIGYLWLNLGAWDGQQIVSREWVENAITPQIGTDRGQDYGYGIWLNDDEPFSYMASGRGGQEIQVIPEFNVVIVKTGGGYDPGQIDNYLGSAVGDLENGMPENPEGQAQLQEALVAILDAPEAEPVPSLPAIVQEISGKNFILESNGILNSALTLTFPETGEARLEFTVQNESEPRVSLVGLDGLYRASVSGKPVLARGEWVDEKTFVIEYNEGPGLNLLFFWMKFEGNQLEMKITDVGTFVGTMEP
ncbi:MAG: beta-lactamase family protein [Chloroflexi bacterium]|nr:beta-lactamase family protein [Chloroflexota bacterium]